MAILDMNKSTTTDLDNNLTDYSVDSATPDSEGEQKETYWDFPDADKYQGYYENIPELKKAIDLLGIWVVGKGFETDNRTKVILENIRGWGEDTINSLLWNIFVQKMVHGDGFAEIVRDENGRILNLKPLYPGHVRIVVNDKGIITRYEHRIHNKKNGFRKIKPQDMFHTSNDRVANNIHGTSVIKACQKVIDYRNEALDTEAKLRRRQLALGVLYVDTDNTSKRNTLISQYENAIKNGEVLVLPQDTAKLEDPGVTPQNNIEWIRYLENFFYQAIGIPRVIASSQEYSEAASKIGYMTFEPVYTFHQTQLEGDIWGQLGFRIKFNRPPSLSGVVSQDEQKNTSQTGIQPNEIQPTATRTE